jgi:hypothetical protein
MTKQNVDIRVTEAAYSGLSTDQKRLVVERNALPEGTDRERKSALIVAVGRELDRLERILVRARKAS